MRTATGEPLSVEVLPGDSVAQLKQKVAAARGFPPETQKLIFDGKMMEDGQLMRDLGGMGAGSSVHLVVSVPKSATKRITVMSVKGDQCVLEVKDTDSIASIKAKLADSKGVPAEQMKLVFAGKELQNDRTVADSNIETDSTLHLVLALQ